MDGYRKECYSATFCGVNFNPKRTPRLRARTWGGTLRTLHSGASSSGHHREGARAPVKFASSPQLRTDFPVRVRWAGEETGASDGAESRPPRAALSSSGYHARQLLGGVAFLQVGLEVP